MIRIFGALIVIQFVVVVLHDWLDIPGWNYGSQVQAAIGRRTLLIATIINGVFPATAVVFLFPTARHHGHRSLPPICSFIAL